MGRISTNVHSCQRIRSASDLLSNLFSEGLWGTLFDWGMGKDQGYIYQILIIFTIDM